MRGGKVPVWVFLIGGLGWLIGGDDDQDRVDGSNSAAAAIAPNQTLQSPDTTRQRAAVKPSNQATALTSSTPTTSPNLQPSPQPSERSIYVSGSSVRVRAGPGTQHTHLTSFKRGQKLTFTGETNGKWRKIQRGSVSGWMHGDYLSFDAPRKAEKPARQPAKVATVSRGPSDDQLRQRIIARSIANYSGSCPCPYNRDRAGRRCGKRSAYSRPGGASPVCYPSDVSSAMLARARN